MSYIILKTLGFAVQLQSPCPQRLTGLQFFGIIISNYQTEGKQYHIAPKCPTGYPYPYLTLTENLIKSRKLYNHWLGIKKQ